MNILKKNNYIISKSNRIDFSQLLSQNHLLSHYIFVTDNDIAPVYSPWGFKIQAFSILDEDIYFPCDISDICAGC